MRLESSVYCVIVFQLSLLTIVTYSQVDTFGPQRFNCPKSYTFTNSRLQGGLQAGQFKRLGPPDDTELCVQRCCDQRSCDLVAWIGDHCYSVSCVNRELCKPVRLPSYHKGMRLLYIASREDAEDEVEPNRREISERSPNGAGRYEPQRTITRRDDMKSHDMPRSDVLPPEVPSSKSFAQVKRIIRSLEEIEDEDSDDFTKGKTKRSEGKTTRASEKDENQNLLSNNFYERNSEKMNFKMEEPSGEEDWEGDQLNQSGAAEDDEENDDILQGHTHGISAVKRTEPAVVVSPENLNEFKHSTTAKRRMIFDSEDVTDDDDEISGETEHGGQSGFGSSGASIPDANFSDDVSESASGSGKINKTIMREVERNLYKVWRYASSKDVDMVARGPKGKEEEDKLQDIYNLVIKHESGSDSSKEDGKKPAKESVSGEAGGVDNEFSDFPEESADGSASKSEAGSDFPEESADSSASKSEAGSALSGENEEETNLEFGDVSGEASGEADVELSVSIAESASGSGEINKNLMKEVEQNLHKVWRYAAPKKDLDMVAKGPKGKEEEEKLRKIYNIVSKHESGSAFMDFEKKKAGNVQDGAAKHKKKHKSRKSSVKFAKGKHESEEKILGLQKARKMKYDKNLRHMRPWGMGTEKSYGHFAAKNSKEEKDNKPDRLKNWKLGAAKVPSKSKDVNKLVLLGEEMKEMDPSDEDSSSASAQQNEHAQKNGKATADQQGASTEDSENEISDKTKEDKSDQKHHRKPSELASADIILDTEKPFDKTKEEIGKKLEQMILSRVKQLEKQNLKENTPYWKDRKVKNDDDDTDTEPLSYQDVSHLKEDRLLRKLEKLKFISNPSTVYNTTRFVYLKQCGLYVEEYNVSKTRASWNNDLFSPYSYLYEMPKDYHKCNSSVWMNRTDLRGDVFLSFRVMSLKGSTMTNNGKICEQYCCHEPRCQSWTLRLQQADTANCAKGSYCCWLKSAIPTPIQDSEHCTSGIVHRESTKHPPAGMRSAVPLGGLGTGSFELRADGTIHEWTIENQSPGGSAKLNKGALNLAVFGVRVADDSKSDAALLRIHAPHGYQGVESLSYSGVYPVSKLTPGGSITEHVDMDLYAFPSFHAREPYKSAVPAVAFTLGLRSKHDKPLDISFMFNLPLGLQDDTIRVGDNFGEVVFTRMIKPADCAHACTKMPKCMSWTTNGPTSCLLKDKMPLHAWATGIVSGLKSDWTVKDSMLTSTRPGFFPQSGSTTLHVVDEEGRSGSFAVADDFNDIWQNFSKSGEIGVSDTLNNTGLHGSAAVKTTLNPGESKTVTIILSWYFPHRDMAKVHVGNLYSALFKSSEDAAQHMRKDLEQSVIDIQSWHDPILGTKPIKKEPINDKARRFPERSDEVNELPDWLKDLLVNSMSFWRSGFWTEDGKWRQWEAMDCNDIDTIQNDMQRIIPYTMFFPELVRDLLLSWADNQFSSGMMQEALTTGCLGPTGKLDYAGGRVMADTTTMFVVGLYHYYQWTGDQATLDRLWPAAKRAMAWVMMDSTRGTGLPFRKVSTYDIVALDKYDHDAYNSFVYLLSLRAAQELGTLKNDTKFISNVKQAFERGQKRVDLELWDEKKEYYHAWWDMEYGSPDWIMSDSLYGQVWAYTLGLGDLVPRDKLKAHLVSEVKRNDSPFGLKVLHTGETEMTPEDTSIILSRHIPGCKSLENITKHNSVWMGADADWASLMLHLDTDPIIALNRAKKSLDHWRSTLNDQWNIHGLISSNGYGLDGLPWATSHYTFHLVLWHIPLALSGQQYYAPNASLTFWPKFPIPFKLPFFTPKASGTIQGAYVKGDDNEEEELFTFTVKSGSLVLKELAVLGSTYGKGQVSFKQEDSVTWSRPKQDVKNILQQL